VLPELKFWCYIVSLQWSSVAHNIYRIKYIVRLVHLVYNAHSYIHFKMIEQEADYLQFTLVEHHVSNIQLRLVEEDINRLDYSNPLAKGRSS
jgi:hypothetical protein